MEYIKKFDLKVLLVLFVITVGVDFFKDPNFGADDVLYGLISSVIGTFLWGVIKGRIGF